MPAHIVHVIPHLSLGGAGRALLGLAEHSARLGAFTHEAISLSPPQADAIGLARKHDIRVTTADTANVVSMQLASADIVQFHFWNEPQLYEFFSQDLPAMRSVMWCHVNGEHPPHVILDDLGDLADVVVASDPWTMRLPLFRLTPTTGTNMIRESMDFGRLDGFQRTPHPTFNVGYIGTMSFAKLHEQYVSMHSLIDIPQARFIAYGGGNAVRTLERQAAAIGMPDRFEFAGYAENIRDALSTFDVFGYPLCEDNYGTGELVLQEAMYAGVPPVVFPYGGAGRLVDHEETGLVVNSPAEYAQAIVRLYEQPQERLRLGRNAARRARELFGAEKPAASFNTIYDQLMSQPKRQHSPFRTASRSAGDTCGARLLIASLGPHADDFAVSRTSDAVSEDTLAAELRIANVSRAMVETIIRYRNHFPRDGYLRLWSGMVMANIGHPAMAAAEFKQSIALGLEHPRVYRYLAEVALKAGASGLADDASSAARGRHMLDRPASE